MDPINILHLSSGDTLEDAKRNFRILSLKLHPDKNPNDPLATSKFQEICNAYRLIEKNPKILEVIKQKKSKGFIQTQVDATIEDIYFYRELKTAIDGPAPCPSCHGTGCKDKKYHKCIFCNGLGHINSEVLKMMGKSNICPNCNGTGLDSKDLCDTCYGTKIINSTKTYMFKVSLLDYRKGYIILKDKNKIYDNIHIKLNIIPHDLVKIEFVNNQLGEGFVVHVPTRAVQHIIGDECSINVFGERIKYTIHPGEHYYVAVDKRPPYRKLYIKFEQYMPMITDETRPLYEKIRELEKSYKFLNIEPII